MTRRIRVLVLDQARGLWGAQSYLLRLADPLAAQGIDLVLATPPEFDLAVEWKSRGLLHVDIALPSSRSVRVDGDGSRLSLRAAAHEAAVLRTSARCIAGAALSAKADVIHANGHAVHLDAALAGRLAHIPVVLHLHEEMNQRFGRALRVAAVAAATTSVAVSRALAGGLPRPLRRRVCVIANGVDVTEFAPRPADGGVRRSLGAAPEEVLLVALTRLDPEKRIEDLVEALTPMRNWPGWHLAIVGKSSSYPGYARDVRELAAARLGDRVTFAGRREDVAAILNACDVLVHAGVVEGMPLGLIEAQASGIPVVAYRVAGVPEAVIDTTTGLLAAAGDVAQLRAQIRTLISGSELRAKMGSAGREHAVRHHGIERQADAQAELMKAMLRRRNVDLHDAAPINSPPRILVVNHWHDDNRGDSAITQGILTLVREATSDSRITLTTLVENGALWAGSTRHQETFSRDLVAVPSPIPTELRGRKGERTRLTTARQAALWGARLVPHIPALLGMRRSSAWKPLVEDSDLVILAGGSNIFDDRGVPAVLSLPRLAEVLSPVQTAVRSGTPVLLLGHTLGPFSRRSGRWIARRLLRGVHLVVVREATSVDVAHGIGVSSVEEAPDMAFAILPQVSTTVERMLASLPAPPRRTLVLSARQHPTLGATADNRLVEIFADAARELVHSGRVDGVAVIAHTIGPTPVEDDRPISRRLAAELTDVPVVLIDEDVSPAELSAFYGAVAGVVAVRLHAAILALNAGTPTFAVSYLTTKTQGVMTQVGLPEAVAEFGTVTVGEIVSGMSKQLMDPEIRGLLEHKSDVRRKELFEASARWLAMLRTIRTQPGHN